MPHSRTVRGTNSSDTRTQTGRHIAVATSRGGGKRPRNTDSAGTAKPLPSRIRPGARPVPKNTGSIGAGATPSGKLWKRKNQPRSRPEKPGSRSPGSSRHQRRQSQEAGKREYERKRRQTPEHKEQKRGYTQAKRQEAKSHGLRVTCWAPTIPGETRCETCAEQHRQYRR